MSGAATDAGLPKSRPPSHDPAATANLIGCAIACDAPLALAAFVSVYFPPTTLRSA